MFLVCCFSFLLRTLIVATPAMETPVTARTRAMIATTIAGDCCLALTLLIPTSSVTGASSRRRRDSKGAGSVPESELRVLGHHLRGPRRVEDHLGVHLLDPVELADELAHLLRDLGADRAGRRRQGEGDEDLAVLHLDVVDEAERDEVEPQLGVDHLFQGLVDLFFAWHAHKDTRLGAR